jgi:hypothetical protein
MAAFVTGIVGAAAAAGLTELDTVLLKTQRSIAGIFPDVTIEEHHTDEIEVSRHPIEQGAPISDHAYKRPAQLTMRVGWSDSTVGLIGNQFIGIGLEGAILDTYRQLQRLQESLQLFTVVTGKRTYHNMLMVSLSVSTTKESENTLIAEIRFEEVFLVSTQTGNLPPVVNQADPQSTAEPVNVGTVQAQPVIPSQAVSNAFSIPVAPPFNQ